jgi:acetyl esterase/lipase
MRVFTVLLMVTFGLLSCQAQSNIIELWPNSVPDQTSEKQEAKIAIAKGDGVIRIAEVTNPILTIYTPPSDKANGKGIIICPGGGYNILAHNLEGTEIAEWLSSLGYAAFVLQYRVPQKQAGALQDAQRAIRIVRNEASKWNLNVNQIGLMGFSAGGSLSARASTLYDQSTYDKIDMADDLSSKPDFSILIYPAYLDKGENRALTPELEITEATPPMFIFATADDRYANSALVMTTALRDAKVPVELHFLAEGGHGYGLRSGNTAAETWPKLLEGWLSSLD